MLVAKNSNRLLFKEDLLKFQYKDGGSWNDTIKLNATSSDNIELYMTGDISINGKIKLGGNVETDSNIISQKNITSVENIKTTNGDIEAKNNITSTDGNVIARQNCFKEIVNDGVEQTGGVIPKGAIIMWSYQQGEIPHGWALCDGNNGTPDLRNRFIKAGNKTNVLDTGGHDEIKLEVKHMPSHTHTFVGTKLPDHTHGYHDRYVHMPNTPNKAWQGHWDGNDLAAQKTNDHSRNTKGVNGNGLTPSGTIDPKGEGKSLEWAPSYIVLAFIMKL